MYARWRNIGLNIRLFMRPSIVFEWKIPISNLNDRIQVKGKKGGDRSCLLMLEHMATLV